MANVKSLKLYRGLSSNEFRFATKDVFKSNRETWAKIIHLRAKGDFKFPLEMNEAITSLHQNLRLENQYFTDSKAIAAGYAKKVGGVLVELTVPLSDVLKHFDIEFQNFGQRRRKFEIVYRVKGSTIVKWQKKWRLRLL